MDETPSQVEAYLFHTAEETRLRIEAALKPAFAGMLKEQADEHDEMAVTIWRELLTGSVGADPAQP